MFSSDVPIIRPEDDKLGRNAFAKKLAQMFLNLDSKDSFTIGLSGKWGSGKTSLVNMALIELGNLLKDEDCDEKPIVVHFEPWNYADSSQLLSQFLSCLSKKFLSTGAQLNISIGQALENYSGAFDAASVIPGFGPFISAAGKTGFKALGKQISKNYGKNDISKQKETVCKLLKKQSNRVLVVIDDIDRLSSIQIRQIFQLVSSVAKFPNMIYLLVFDEDIVLKSLQNVQGGTGKDYLEKIIQIPIHIPEVQQHLLDEVLLNNMNQLLTEYAGVCFQENYWHTVYYPCVAPYINNIRDINRLCNAVRFKLTSIYKEINFTDIVAITTIELALPQVYVWIKQSKSVLTGSFDILSFRLMNKPSDELYSIFSEELRPCLTSDLGRDANEHDIKSIMDILAILFPFFSTKTSSSYGARDMGSLRRNNHIADPERFDRYFSLDLAPNELKQSDILQAVYSLDAHELSQFILERDEQSASYMLLEEIRARITDLPSERAKIIITALVAASAHLSPPDVNTLLSANAKTFLRFLVIELLEKIDASERSRFTSDIINNGDTQSFSTIASVLNTIELGYGRLAANGEENSRDKVISLDELIQLEDIFKQRAKSLLKDNSLFIFDQWYIVSYLLECYDPDYMDGYLSTILEDDGNVLEYICSSISAWQGGSTEYEVKDDYKKYLTDERVLQAIESERISGGLFSHPDDVQSKSTAFYIKKKVRPDSHDHIPQADVDALLAEWKSTSSRIIHEHQHQKV